MSPILLQEEGDVSFVKSFKFISELFDSCQPSYLYGLLHQHRKLLVTRGKLKGYDQPFFYPNEWLADNLKKPNSPNHILKLLNELKKARLINFYNTSKYPYTRMFEINDSEFHRLAKEYGKKIENKRKLYYEVKKDQLHKSELCRNVYLLGVE